MEKLKNLETLEKANEEIILEPTKLDKIKNNSKEYYIKKFFKCIFSCASNPSITKNTESAIQELNISKDSESIEILMNKTENLEQNLENIKENVENIKENVEKIKEKKESEESKITNTTTEEDNKEINDKLVEIQKAHEKIEELEELERISLENK